MNDHDRERLVAALNRLRPDWPAKQLQTLLADDRIAGRPYRDLAVALTWVACEPSTANPYRVLEAGPWWRAASVDGHDAHLSDVAPVGSRCTVCGEQEQRCRSRWAGDHEFTRPIERDVDLTPVVAELKSHIAPTKPASDLVPTAENQRVAQARELLHPTTKETTDVV